MGEAPATDVERLYGLDLDEFTPARDATARRLRSDGRRDEADAVRRLRKPSNPAWVVNRLARDEPGVVAALTTAGRTLREAQLGGGDRDDLRRALEGEREALDRAMRNAEEIATHAGLATQATLQRVRETLHLAALDPAVAAEVERGVVVHEGRATGLAGLAAPAATTSQRRRAAKAPPAEAPRAPPADAAPERETRERKAAADRERKAAAAREQRAAAARERAAERRARRLAEARERVTAAERELARVERDLERVRGQVERARARLASARGRMEEIERA